MTTEYNEGQALPTLADFVAAGKAARELMESSEERKPNPEGEGFNFSGERLKLLRAGLEGIAMQITGEYDGARHRQRIEQRFANAAHALGTLMASEVDGYSAGSSAGARLAEVAAYGTNPQWSKQPGIPGTMREAEDVAEVRKAWDHAWRELPETGGRLDREGCQMVCCLRVLGHLTTQEVADVILDQCCLPISKSMAGRVARWGEQRVYEYLRERDMVPEKRRPREEEDMRTPKSDGADLIGWKSICVFLGVSRTTATKLALEEDDPLPVRKFGGRVEASKAEVRAWRERKTEGLADE